MEKKTYEISEESAVAIRQALGKLPHDMVNNILVFFEKSLILKKEEKVEPVLTQ